MKKSVGGLANGDKKCYTGLMINISIIEDDKKEAKRLHDLLIDYQSEKNCAFFCSVYATADEFLAAYRGGCDVLFVDIELPGTDGMTAMKKLRRQDSVVDIIFVTGLARYATNGYVVGAFDYILKPVERVSLFATLDGVLRRYNRRRIIRVSVNTAEGEIFLDSKQITYIEVFGHFLVYHIGGKQVTEWATLGKPERALAGYGFARCHKSYLVNLRYVEDVIGDEVCVAGKRLKIGKTRYKSFMASLNEYLGV